MALQNHKATLLFTLFIFLFLIIKFFTTEITLSDDPTTMFVIKHSTSY